MNIYYKKLLLISMLCSAGVMKSMQQTQKEREEKVRVEQKSSATAAMQVEQPTSSSSSSSAEKYATATIEVAFGPAATLDLNEFESISYASSYGELAKKQHAAGWPYLLVRVITRSPVQSHNQGMQVHYYDAHNFNKHYFNHQTHTYPLLRSLQDRAGDNEALLKLDIYQNQNRDFEYKNILNNLSLNSMGIHYFQMAPPSAGDNAQPKFTYFCSHADLFLGPKKEEWHRKFELNQQEDRALHDGIYAQAVQAHRIADKAWAQYNRAVQTKADAAVCKALQEKSNMCIESARNLYDKARYSNHLHARAEALYALDTKYADRSGPASPAVKFLRLTEIDVSYLIPAHRVDVLFRLAAIYEKGLADG